MTNIYSIQNNREKDRLIELLKNQSLPFKCLIQTINRQRSVDWNAYYWGVVLKYIADYTGHTSEEVHELLKDMFRVTLEFSWRKKEVLLRAQSTTEDDNYEFQQYIEQCCAWALDFLKVLIPDPWEIVCQDKFNVIKL